MSQLVYGISGPSGPFGMGAIAFVALLLVASWVVLASSRFIQGGVVEQPNRVPQLYGYTACLIGLIMGLTSLRTVVESSLTLAEPTYSGARDNWAEPSVTSFEAFRVTYERFREMRVRPDQGAPEPISEAELQRRYEAHKADRIARNQVAAKRSLIIATFTLLVAVALFVGHWRWLRGRVHVAATG